LLYAPRMDSRGGHMWMLADGSLLATSVSD
jgi:hypothetical protein